MSFRVVARLEPSSAGKKTANRYRSSRRYEASGTLMLPFHFAEPCFMRWRIGCIETTQGSVRGGNAQDICPKGWL